MTHQKITLSLVLAFHVLTPHTIYAGKWINWHTVITDISSCVTEIVDSIKDAFAGKNLFITGTQTIQTKTISTPNIDTITVSGSALVIITQDSTQQEELIIEADEAILSYVDVCVSNNELTIGIKKNVSYNTTVQNVYRVNTKKPLKINTSGAINIEIKDINTSHLSMNVTGSTKINGSLSVNQLNIDAAGSCNIKLSGQATEQNITISGSSSFDGHNLHGKNMIINGSGAVHVYSNVSDIIEGNLSGSGSLIYLNSPIIGVHATKAVSIEKW